MCIGSSVGERLSHDGNDEQVRLLPDAFGVWCL